MTGKARNASNLERVPPSLQRRAMEAPEMVIVEIPLSWWDELFGLAQEFDQEVSTFVREAIEDWLRRARIVRQQRVPRS
jgi:hypothetical protein